MTTATYPAQFESDVVLPTGHTLLVRPVRPDDRERLLRFYARLSPEAVHARFFELCLPECAVAHSPTTVDYNREFGVVAERENEIAGVAHYFAMKHDPKCAEVAFAVAEEAADRGVGTRLLEVLVAAATSHGIERFEAEELVGSQGMLDIFLDMGFPIAAKAADGTMHLSFPIAATPLSVQRAADRAQFAASASMRAIFAPRSIAVIGASRRRGQLGNEIVRNLQATGYRGALYVVNPHADTIESVPAFASMSEIPEAVELAVIVVPAASVESVLDDCIAKRVAAVVIISAGFGETGEAGRAAERRLLAKARTAGIRIVGPNCMGVINTDPTSPMHATFSSLFPPRGNVAMSSQSGALGLAVLDYARSLQIGFSTFISVGNKVDVSGNDLIQYWAEDDATDVILLYLESFGNPRKFAELARRVGRTKPIVAVKAGRSVAGAHAASSHTGALAASDGIVDDLFRQSGVIRTETLEEMFDVATLLANQPLPRENRVAIVTNAGGPAILAADACEANGLELAQLGEETVARLRALLPSAANIGNPIDMIASASAEHYRHALALVLADPAVDSVIAIYIPVLPAGAAEVAAAIRDCTAETKDKCVLTTFMSAAGSPTPLSPIPAFPFPERATKALAAATRYAEWRRTSLGSVIEFDDINPASLRAIVDAELAVGGGWLDPFDVADMLAAIHIDSPVSLLARSANDAVEAAMGIGFPVALKAYGTDLLHKSDVGGVRLSLQDESSVFEAYEELVRSLGERMTGAVVQSMVSGGVEMMIGAADDPMFGQIIGVGAGGTLVELLHDVAFRLHPLTDADPLRMIGELRSAKLLGGFRGTQPSDIGALQDALLRLSALLEICPEIRELDINPLKVLASGVSAVDARIRIEPPPPAALSRRIRY